MLKKMNEQTNINWFEIPVSDSNRARKFYETILDIKMHTEYIEETKEELTFFPAVPGMMQAPLGSLTGVLLKSERLKPSKEGTLIDLNTYPNIQTVIDKIETVGGKVVLPKTKMIAGYISVFIDTEGNTVALHSEA
jgi:predicted enzyme related to lactoylglutathione lyase